MNSPFTPKGLLDLPDNLLSHIVSLVPPQTIRRLKQVNRKLSCLLAPHRVRQAGPLASLSIDILLCILDYLSPCGRSRLAQTSYSFYPLVMDFILRDNVVHNKSSMLGLAARKDLRKLAQSLIERGADNDTTYGLGAGGVTYGYCSSTPLIKALFQGHVDIVELLLSRGATHKKCGKRTPVSVTIFKGKEDMCLRLLQHSESVNGIQRHLRDETLREACDAKLVRVVYDLLERMGSNTEQAQLDEALFWGDKMRSRTREGRRYLQDGVDALESWCEPRRRTCVVPRPICLHGAPAYV
jgi:hypothetical protein